MTVTKPKIQDMVEELEAGVGRPGVTISQLSLVTAIAVAQAYLKLIEAIKVAGNA